MDLERRSSKPEVASSSLAEAKTFNYKLDESFENRDLNDSFGVVQSAGRMILAHEIEVRILAPKSFLFFSFFLRVA